MSYYENGRNIPGKNENTRYVYSPSSDTWIDAGKSSNVEPSYSQKVIDSIDEVNRRQIEQQQISKSIREREEDFQSRMNEAWLKNQEKPQKDMKKPTINLEKEEAISAARARFKSHNLFYKIAHRKEKIDNLPTRKMSIEEINNLYIETKGRAK